MPLVRFRCFGKASLIVLIDPMAKSLPEYLIPVNYWGAIAILQSFSKRLLHVHSYQKDEDGG